MTNELRNSKMQKMVQCYDENEDKFLLVIEGIGARWVRSSKLSPVWLAMVTKDQTWITETRNDIIRSIIDALAAKEV